MSLNNQQVQELTDCIADKCEELEFTPEEILDAIARSLIAASHTFEVRDVTVSIDGVGVCSVTLTNEHF